MSPAAAPVKNATYKAIIVFKGPKIKPKRNANFTSPKPMAFPRVPRKIKRKNKRLPTAASRLTTTLLGK